MKSNEDTTQTFFIYKMQYAHRLFRVPYPFLTYQKKFGTPKWYGTLKVRFVKKSMRVLYLNT